MNWLWSHILIATSLANWTLAMPTPVYVPGYTDRQGRQSTYQHNEVNEYTGVTVGSQTGAPVHDDAGNLTSNGSGYGFAYDYENHLTRVFVDGNHNGQQDTGETVLADYTYDALGHRVKQVKAGQTTLFYYDGETVLAEYNGTGSLQRYHVHGPTYVDEHVVLHEAGATPAQDHEYYYLLTSLYSVSGLADASGAVVERYRYDAYGMAAWLSAVSYGDFNGDGKVDLQDFLIFQAAFSGESPCSEAGRICDSNGDGKVDLEDYRAFDAAWTGSGGSGATSSISPFRFTGQPLDFQLSDPTTGRPTLVLCHFRGREYNAYDGRFLQHDPAEYADSCNLYLAMRGNPLGRRDPSGRMSLDETMAVTTIGSGVLGMLIYGIMGEDPARGLGVGLMAGGGASLAFVSGAGIIAMGAVAGLMAGTTDTLLQDPLFRQEDAINRLVTNAVGDMIFGGASAAAVQGLAPALARLAGGLALSREPEAVQSLFRDIGSKGIGATAEVRGGVVNVELGGLFSEGDPFSMYRQFDAVRDGILDMAAQGGATFVVVNTGPVQNVARAEMLMRLIERGETYRGGLVKLVSGGPPPIFEIVFDTLEGLTK